MTDRDGPFNTPTVTLQRFRDGWLWLARTGARTLGMNRGFATADEARRDFLANMHPDITGCVVFVPVPDELAAWDGTVPKMNDIPEVVAAAVREYGVDEVRRLVEDGFKLED